jgi:hypothetical protein
MIWDISRRNRMSTRLRVLTVVMLFATLLLLAACGGGKTAPPAPVNVTVAPLAQTIDVLHTATFAATVTGDSNTAVTWSASAGTITAAGVYTPPMKAGTYTITATSVADTVQKGFASVVVTAPKPTITSDPTPIAALEGSEYTYQLVATDPAETAITYKLGAAPAGAELVDDTITWTPTPGQSRVANSFSVTAKTDAGGSATQAWTVSPAGTVTVSYFGTFWTVDGKSTDVSWADLGWSSPFPTAWVLSEDGTFPTAIDATDNEDGTFTLTGVPAGHYWLQLYGDLYWTDTGAFDFGSDFTGRPNESTSVSTTLDFDLTGLSPTYEGESWLDVYNPNAHSGWEQQVPDAAPGTFAGTYPTNMTAIDSATDGPTYVIQYDGDAEETAEMSGDVWVGAIASGLTLNSFSTVAGGSSDVHGAMGGTPKNFDVNIKGSEWQNSLFKSGPSLYSMDDFFAELDVLPFVSDVYAAGSEEAGPAELAYIEAASGPTDQSFGVFHYVNPYPEAWTPVFGASQAAEYAVVPPGSSDSEYFWARTSFMTSEIPTGPIAPMMSGPQNAKINGNDFFTSNITAADVTLSWEAPTGLAPFGYEVAIQNVDSGYAPFVSIGPGSDCQYASDYCLYTSETSLAVPPGMLESGQSYVFTVRAMADARAQMNTMPWRSKLPMADASIVSGAVTITGSVPPAPAAIKRMKASMSTLSANSVTAQRLTQRKLRSRASAVAVKAAKERATARKASKQPLL